MNKFFNFFKDSYGIDKFSKYIFGLGLILMISRLTQIAGFALIIYAIWRSISRNKYKRYQELQAFENYLLIIKQRYYSLKLKFNDFRKYKVFKCPKCSQKLRVPRKSGKVTITCKKCGSQFKGKA